MISVYRILIKSEEHIKMTIYLLYLIILLKKIRFIFMVLHMWNPKHKTSQFEQNMRVNSSGYRTDFLSFLLFVYLSVSVPLHPVLSSSPSSIPVPLIHCLSPSVRPCLSLPHKSNVTMSGCHSGFKHTQAVCVSTHDIPDRVCLIERGFMNDVSLMSLCPLTLPH